MIQKCVAFLRKRDEAAHGDIQYLRTEFNQTLALGETAFFAAEESLMQLGFRGVVFPGK